MTFYLYLWSVSEGLGSALTGLVIICGIVAAIFTVFVVVLKLDVESGQVLEKDLAFCLKWSRTMIITTLSLIASAVLLPSKKDLAIMYVVPSIAESDIAEEIEKDFPELYRMGIDAIKAELLPESESIAPRK